MDNDLFLIFEHFILELKNRLFLTISLFYYFFCCLISHLMLQWYPHKTLFLYFSWSTKWNWYFWDLFFDKFNILKLAFSLIYFFFILWHNRQERDLKAQNGVFCQPHQLYLIYNFFIMFPYARTLRWTSLLSTSKGSWQCLVEA